MPVRICLAQTEWGTILGLLIKGAPIRLQKATCMLPLEWLLFS